VAIVPFGTDGDVRAVVSKAEEAANVVQRRLDRKAKRDPTTKPTTKQDGSAPVLAPTVSTRPQWPYIIVALALFAIGLILGVYLQYRFHPNMTKLPKIAGGVGIFSVLYVMAQSIERLLVPVSWFGGGFLGVSGTGFSVNGVRTKSELTATHQAAVAEAMNNRDDEGKAQEAANAQHDLDQYRANLTATTFGAASLLAMLVSSYTGLFLLSAVGLHAAGWLDVLVTGLAVAGGTKPLHDLISNISSVGKQNKQLTAAI
jgi:hypothetical protein